MAATKQSSARKRPNSKSASTRKSGNASRSSSGSRNGSARTTPAKKRASTKRATSTRARTTSANSGGVSGTIKHVANTAKRPAVAVGAAAAGLAGGLVLRSRTRRRTVLGMPVPRSLERSLSGLDAKSVAKSVGQASKRFAKTSKTVSKDLERAGDQAERIGRILD